MRLFLSRLCGPLAGIALVLALAMPAAAQTSWIGGMAATSPNTQTPPPAQTKPPPPDPAAQPAAPDPAAEDTRSLFAPRWNMFQLGGRFSSVSGDPARWQRYQDLRDGLLFTQGRVLHETPDWNGTLGADNVGWRDSRFFGSYERVGLLKINGLWDEIPQFYSVDTATAFTEAEDGVLLLDDNAQRAASHNAYLSISPQFDLRERRAVGTFRVSATPTRELRRHWRLYDDQALGRVAVGGELRVQQRQRGGAALPIPHERHGRRSRVDEQPVDVSRRLQRFVVQQPGRYADLGQPAGADGFDVRLRGMAGWPCGRPTRCRRSARRGTRSSRGGRSSPVRSPSAGRTTTSRCMPFTINSALPQIPLPRATTDASATTVATTISLVSRPEDDWRFSARFRRYAYNNDMPDTPIDEIISYDTSVGESTTGGPQPYAHARNTFDADATWTGFQPVALTARIHQQPQQHTTFASSSRRTRTCCSSRRTRSGSGG